MMWFRAASISLLLIVSACRNSAFDPEPGPVAIVSATQGFPTIQRHQRSYILAARSQIFVGDIITTDGQSRLTYLFVDGSRFEQGSDSQLLLHDYRAHRRGALINATLTRGGVAAHLKARGPLTLKTSMAAAILVRGEIVARIDPGTVKLALLQNGNLSVENDDGDVQLRESGMGVTVPAGAAPSLPTLWTSQKLSRLLDDIAMTSAEPAP